MPSTTNPTHAATDGTDVRPMDSIMSEGTIVGQQTQPRPTTNTVGFSTIVNIFVGMRRHRARVAKSHYVDSTSGEETLTHTNLQGEAVTSPKRLPVRQEDHYICSGGVDAAKLLRGTRASLLQQASHMGANALIEEKWKCNITGPKNGAGNFKAHVIYSALATRAMEAPGKPSAQDPQKPVALERVKCIPGLMTIVSRA